MTLPADIEAIQDTIIEYPIKVETLPYSVLDSGQLWKELSIFITVPFQIRAEKAGSVFTYAAVIFEVANPPSDIWFTMIDQAVAVHDPDTRTEKVQAKATAYSDAWNRLAALNKTSLDQTTQDILTILGFQ